MRVLIGITTFNRAEILGRSIQSALDQDHPDKEVAIFDDASTDSTPKLQAKFPNVRWWRVNSNQGYLAGRNFMMRQTEADLYFSLDDDAWFLAPDAISVGVRLMKTYPHVAAIAYDILSPDKINQVERAAPRKTNVFIGCGHMLRLGAVRKAGFYAPGPAAYGVEESDLCLRFLNLGYEVCLLPGVHVWHEKSSLARQSDEQYSSVVCNDLAFAVRRCPFPLVAAGISAKLLSHLRFAVGNDYLAAYSSGLCRFLKSFPQLVATRDPVRNSAVMEFRRRSRAGFSQLLETSLA